MQNIVVLYRNLYQMQMFLPIVPVLVVRPKYRTNGLVFLGISLLHIYQKCQNAVCKKVSTLGIVAF